MLLFRQVGRSAPFWPQFQIVPMTKILAPPHNSSPHQLLPSCPQMNLTSVEKQHPTYDFDLARDIKDALSIAPSRAAGGGGGSVCSRSQQPHTQPSVKTFNPRTRASVGGSDAFSVAASTSMSQLVNRNGKFPVMIVYVDIYSASGSLQIFTSKQGSTLHRMAATTKAQRTLQKVWKRRSTI